MREEVQSRRLNTDEIAGDKCPGIGCFPVQTARVGVSKECQASAPECCCDVTCRSINRKDSFSIPYNPEIILHSGLSRDALNGLHQLTTNRRAMLLLPALFSGRHDHRANAMLCQSIDRRRPFFWSPILTSPARGRVDVQVIGR